MREWIKQLHRRVFRQRAAEQTQPVRLVMVAAAAMAATEVRTINVEEWLDHKAQELNGDWSLARLGSFSRGEDAIARQTAAATLKPTEELSLELAQDELYARSAIRVRTLLGQTVGYLEPSAAEQVSGQMRAGELVRCFVYKVTLNEQESTSSVILALMSWAFSPVASTVC